MQPVIDAEAWQAKRSVLLEVRKPSRRQDPTVWETFAKHPGAFRSVGCHQLTVRASPAMSARSDKVWVSDAPIEAE